MNNQDTQKTSMTTEEMICQIVATFSKSHIETQFKEILNLVNDLKVSQIEVNQFISQYIKQREQESDSAILNVPLKEEEVRIMTDNFIAPMEGIAHSDFIKVQNAGMIYYVPASLQSSMGYIVGHEEEILQFILLYYPQILKLAHTFISNRKEES